MNSKSSTAYKRCLGDSDKNNFTPDIEAVSKVVLENLLNQLAITVERGKQLQCIIEQIHLEKGNLAKVAVFAAAGAAVDAARKAMKDNSITITEVGDSNFHAFARPDVTVEDKAKPRIALLTFDQATGLNLQHSCSDIVLFAPLYTGSDPVTSCGQEQQAIGRVHRLGQSKPVSVYRIIVTGPNDEETLDSVLLKRNTAEKTKQAVTCD